MPYLVDSDILIAYREGHSAARTLVERLAPERLLISIVTYMEVYQGTLRGPNPARAEVELDRFLIGIPVVPFSPAAARRCATPREDLDRQGKRIRSRALGLVTTAIALEHGYTLVTRNRKDYADIPDLALYDLSQFP